MGLVMSTVPVTALRDGAVRWVSRIITSLEGSASEPVDAVVAGRVLLVVCGVGVVGFAPLLAPERRTWAALAIVSICMALLLIVSLGIAWSRLPSSTTMIFPGLVCGALAALGLTSPGFAAPLTGVLTLCFAYVGLTQPLRTGLVCLPVAAATFLCTYGDIGAAVTVRLLIALFIWGVLAQLLARLVRRQVTLTALLSGEARHDELTGIANRRDLDARMQAAGPGDTLVMCDLDHFKRVNDTLGHSGGDRVLAEFGAMLRVALRSGDYCARYGGEEFLLILPNCTSTQARALLGRLQHQWGTLQPTVTFSAGVATCTHDRSALETLARADALLYAAKAAGRDRVTAENDGVVTVSSRAALDAP